ncbi:fad binding domain-containing protein [Diplodia corticola]|uniref:Fad binding domain-containing protein n=1 Tax=Diplodia corticola TaxID=236234 RepID=A0A1J9SF74_9PEZI|nr:fad binding domain-containing protein [Diplodia corticola]OJD39063.1 fad binding domain-containing protein [Diplodia corticola]
MPLQFSGLVKRSAHSRFRPIMVDRTLYTCDVAIAGAGPAGLMLADNLARFGIKVNIVDNRKHQTLVGRADGLQPKTLETLRQMRLADGLLRKGVKVYDICFWKSPTKEKMQRYGRAIHYPPDTADLLDPYLLLVHQGIIEDVFINDLKERNVEVRRDTTLMDYEYSGKTCPLKITYLADNQYPWSTCASYLVGCDGGRSAIRKSIGAQFIGASSDSVWGILDGEIETDFPDLWSKALIHSEDAGSVMMMPRERNMTRVYVELKPDLRGGTSRDELSQELVMQRAKEIMYPFHLRWKTVEWFGRYVVGQRVSTKFADQRRRVFICGDAAHTHSPKAAQGMNTSMHDAWNLAWKLNLAVRKLAKPCLLETYEAERRKVAQDLIHFDHAHARTFTTGDWDALATNFTAYTRFISGAGAEYDPNVLNRPDPTTTLPRGDLRPGCLPPPAKATRLADGAPVDVQLDIPPLGQFRIYFFVASPSALLRPGQKSSSSTAAAASESPAAANGFLATVCRAGTSPHHSFTGRMSAATDASYTIQPPAAAPHDGCVCPARYTASSCLLTWALVVGVDVGVDVDAPAAPRARSRLDAVDLLLADLPQALRDSPWTVYLDDVPEADTRRRGCVDKWLGGLRGEETAMAIVRPDGYVGAVRVWPDGGRECGLEAVEWMDEYFEGFLSDSIA